jgi:hypothetical protein
VRARGRAYLPPQWRPGVALPLSYAPEDIAADLAALNARQEAASHGEGRAWARWVFVIRTLWNHTPARIRRVPTPPGPDVLRAAVARARETSRTMREALVRESWDEAYLRSLEFEGLFRDLERNEMLLPAVRAHVREREAKAKGNRAQQERFDRALLSHRELVESVLATHARLGREAQLSSTLDDPRLADLRTALARSRLIRLFPESVVRASRGPTARKKNP